MQQTGNAAVHAEFGWKSDCSRPAANASKDERMDICRNKYEKRVWAQPAYDARQFAKEPPSSRAAVPAQAVRAAASETLLLDDLFQDVVPHEVTSVQAREVARSTRKQPPSTRAVPLVQDFSSVPLETSLLDDLFKDFVPQEETSVQHQDVSQGQCFSTIPCRHTTSPVGRELVVESSLFDELFKDLDTVAKGHANGDSSTAASDDEVSESKVFGKESVVHAVASLPVAGAPTVAFVASYQEQVDSCIWESFGDW